MRNMLSGLVAVLSFWLLLTPVFAGEWRAIAITDSNPYPDEKTAFKKGMAVSSGYAQDEQTAREKTLAHCAKNAGRECSVIKAVPKEQYLALWLCEKNGEYIFTVGTSDLSLRGTIDNAREGADVEWGSVCIPRVEWSPDQEKTVEKNPPLGEVSSTGKWKSIVATYAGDGPSYMATIAHVAFGKGDTQLKALVEAAFACLDSAVKPCDETVTVPSDWYLTLVECYDDNIVTFSLGRSKESSEEAVKDAAAKLNDSEKNECHSYWDWSPKDEWPVLKAELTRMFMFEAAKSLMRRFPKGDNK